MTIIKHKRGAGVPASSELEVGELAIDTLAARLYTKVGNAVVELGGGSSGGSGAGMVISETEPTDPETGLQWLEASTGRVWIWDEDKWLEFPAAVPEVESGAPAVHVGDTPPADPVEGQQWLNTDDGYLYVYYGNAGNPTWMAVERDGSGGGTDPEPEPEPEPDPDPYWPNVALLINCDDEADESQNIVDASAKNQITVVNNAKVSTDNYKYGTGSLNLSGAGYLQCSNTSEALTGSNNFTLEMWVYRNPGSGYQYLYTTGNSCQVFLQSNKVKLFTSAAGNTAYEVMLTSASDVPTGEWVHLCFTKSSSNWKIFINGEEDATVRISAGIGPASYVQVGAFGNNQYRFDGLIDDLRVTKLIARPEYSSASWDPPGKHSTEDGSLRTTVITVDEPAVELQEGDNDADLS